MTKKKILYVTHEMSPYFELSHIADISREMPQQMQDKGYEVRVFMPRFGTIKERKHRLHEVIRLSGINIPVGNDDNPLIIKVASLPSAKMQIYFLDNDDFFLKRDFMGDESTAFYPDNDERVIFFNKGVIEIILKLGWIPDIIHCHGWMSSLVPMYARTVSKHEPVFKNTRFVYTPYDTSFEQTLGTQFTDKAVVNGQSHESFKYLENPGCNDFYLTGVTFADGIALGSENIDETVMNHINMSDKPVLPCISSESDNFIETHDEFYHSLLQQEVVLEK